MNPSGRRSSVSKRFLNLTATSETFFDGRRVPSPSNVSTAEPGGSGFFGRGEQAFLDQTFRVVLTSSTATLPSSLSTGAFASHRKSASTI